MNEKKKDYTKGLSDRQLDLFDKLKEHDVSESLAQALCVTGCYVDIEQAIDTHRKHGMTIQEMLMVIQREKSLSVEERELYFCLTKFCVDPGDEYLALQMVENYDNELLGKLTKELEPSGMDIVEFSKRVLASVRPKIEVVEASEDVGYTESVPF